MGTSNWQNIPYCIEVLMKIEPKRVLDVGVGFGRWGILLHEFCDVWFARIFPSQWQVRVEGIEAFAENVAGYHAAFYDRIHIGDAGELIGRLSGPWDVTVYGDVLEHFEKDTALRLLRASLANSAYVLLNVPLGSGWPQDTRYENEYERHRSSWEAYEFLQFPLIRRAFFQDYLGRPFGTFVFSSADPRNLRAALFSTSSQAVNPLDADGLPLDLVRILRRLEDLQVELQYVKGHSSYRAAALSRASGLRNALRWLRNRNRRIVHLRALGRHHPASQGREVWLMQACANADQHPIPWDFIERGRTWTLRPEPDSAFGQCLLAEQGWLRVPVDNDPELHFLRYPWGGEVELSFRGQRQVIDLYAPRAERVAVHLGRTPVYLTVVEPTRWSKWAPPRPAPRTVPPPMPSERFTAQDEAFMQTVREAGVRVVAVHCPRWLGVTTSTRALFEHVYPVPETPECDPFRYESDTLDHHARVLAESGVEHIVLSGGDELHYLLAGRIRDRNPKIRLDVLWHGSYVHFSEDYPWRVLRLWIDAVAAGWVHRIGTVKKGMERFLGGLGVPARLVLNYVPGQPQPSPPPDDGEHHLGLWVSGLNQLKLPNATLAAVKMTPRARLHAAGLDARTREIIAYFEIPVATLHEKPLPHDELLDAIRRTHLSLYVTFSECCPMLPLESLHVGVPCLIGPTSHLFEDHPYLFERLVVPFPDRADVIAECIQRALSERAAIVEEYLRYIPSYNSLARQSVEAFLA